MRPFRVKTKTRVPSSSSRTWAEAVAEAVAEASQRRSRGAVELRCSGAEVQWRRAEVGGGWSARTSRTKSWALSTWSFHWRMIWSQGREESPRGISYHPRSHEIRRDHTRSHESPRGISLYSQCAAAPCSATLCISSVRIWTCEIVVERELRE